MTCTAGFMPTGRNWRPPPILPGWSRTRLNKIVVNKWGEMGRAGYNWWERISTVEHFNSLQSITGTLVGTVGSLPTVAEGDGLHRTGGG